MNDFIKGIFCESGNSQPSSMRVVFIFGALVCMVVPSFCVVWVTVHTNTVPELPGSVGTFYGMALAGFIGGKVAQKQQEAK